MAPRKELPSWATPGETVVTYRSHSWGTPTRTEGTIMRVTATQVVMVHNGSDREYEYSGSWGRWTSDLVEVGTADSTRRNYLIHGNDPRLVEWEAQDAVERTANMARSCAVQASRQLNRETATAAVQALQAFLGGLDAAERSR